MSDQASTDWDKREADALREWGRRKTDRLRQEARAILHELGRRQHGETTDSRGRAILTVPLMLRLPNPDPFTIPVVHVDPHRVRIMVNNTLIATALGPAEVSELIEFLGAILTSGTWPLNDG